MPRPLISIIVPVYNAEKTLRRCVQSLCEQSIQDYEVLLIDDGSVDGSAELCETLAGKSDRIRVFHKSNGGAASARNLGMDMAQGDYIGFVDSDDYIEKDMYRDLIDIMCQKNIDVLDSLRYRDVSTGGGGVPSSEQTENLVEESDVEAIRQMLLWKGNSSLCTRVFRREFLVGMKIPEGHKVEDFRFLLDVHRKAGRNVTYQKAYYHVVPAPGSVTRSSFSSVFFDAIYQAGEARKFVDSYYPQLRTAADFFLLNCIYLFFVNIPSKALHENYAYCKGLRRRLRGMFKGIFSNKYLGIKEKCVLLSTFVNMRLPNMIYRRLGKH